MDRDEQKFELCNDAPRSTSKPACEPPRARQQSLFMGLNDLPGQTYLVPECNVKDE